MKLAAAMFVLVLFGAGAQASTETTRFAITRNGEQIGIHLIEVNRSGQEISVAVVTVSRSKFCLSQRIVCNLRQASGGLTDAW